MIFSLARVNKKALASNMNQPRILYVEDDFASRLFMSKVLQSRDCLVSVSEEGQEALRRMRLESFDLVLLDITLPDLNGFDVVREIRSCKAGEHNVDITVIAVTGHAMDGFRERCLCAGFDDYLVKPILLEQLVTVLEKYLRLWPCFRADRITPSYPGV